MNDLKLQIEKYKAREESFKQLEAISKLGSWEVDLQTKKSIWSDESYKIYAMDKELNEDVGLDTFLSHLVKEDLTRTLAVIDKVMKDGGVHSFECSIIDEDKKLKHLLLNAKVIYDEENIPLKLIGTTQDITEFSKLKEEVSRFAQVMDSSLNEIYIVDFHTLNYLYVNNGAVKALGYSKDEFLNMSIMDINPYLTKEKIRQLKREYLNNSESMLSRTIHKRKNGKEYHVQSYIHAIEYGKTNSFMIFDTDINDMVELENKIKYQATHDVLTNLPNRALFNDRISQMIKSSKRNEVSFALLFIDLDQFKKINDSLGHQIGDEVLKEVAKRLEKSIREVDTLARLGGDEFTIILKNINNTENISKICTKIVEVIKQPIIVGIHKLYISSSIGISIYPEDAENDKDLIKFADVAMYKAKDEGRDNFQFFNLKLSELALEEAALEKDLRIAIAEEQFVVHFQPQYNTQTKLITGMEALVRWEHPKTGLIQPYYFIPKAEENSLIIQIDRIVMKKAMKQFSEWHKDGLNPGILALNLAMKQLNEDDFIPLLLKTMKEFDFKASWLELEVTEGEVMANPEKSIKKLQELSKLGIELAIDDFGTGYSSLAYLKKLPLDKLKIDRSFVKDISTNEDDIAIIQAIIALAKSLNLRTIAEGVEEENQRELLKDNGCFDIQGYLFSKPIQAHKITELLKTHNQKV